jgi:hypothetical protein
MFRSLSNDSGYEPQKLCSREFDGKMIIHREITITGRSGWELLEVLTRYWLGTAEEIHG